MMHHPWNIPLGGALGGVLPNPTLVVDEAQLRIASAVFGPHRPADVIPTPNSDLVWSRVFAPRDSSSRAFISPLKVAMGHGTVAAPSLVGSGATGVTTGLSWSTSTQALTVSVNGNAKMEWATHTTWYNDLLPQDDGNRSVGSGSLRLFRCYTNGIDSGASTTLRLISPVGIRFFLGATEYMKQSTGLSFGATYGAITGPTSGMILEGVLGVGTSSPNASCLVDLVSTTKGLGLPSMTTTQRNAISSPRAGLMGYDNVLGTIFLRDPTDATIFRNVATSDGYDAVVAAQVFSRSRFA